jgi:isocitrate dehydrogenase kinase/phosphatase
MLAKNFGVTRHGRVVFYDYDEVSPLTDCAFRVMPAPRDEDDVLAAEPWFSVGEGDIFPEELERFLRFPEALHRAFVAEHGDLFTADYWNRVKASVSSAGVIEPAPYGVERRLGTDERGE